MAEIVIQRGTSFLPANTETIDVPVALQQGVPGTYFVRLVGNTKYAQIVPSRNTNQLNRSVSVAVFFLNATTLRLQASPGGNVWQNQVDWEIWEFIGGSNLAQPLEFQVRAQGTQLASGIGGAIPNPFPMTTARNVVVFTGGMIWGTGGSSVAPAAGQVILQCDSNFGTNWLRWHRGVNDAVNVATVYYTAVEFFGDWQVGWVLNSVPPVGITNTDTLSQSIVDWNKAFIHIQRIANNQIGASQGMVAWPGPSPTQVRVSYPTFGSAAVPWNQYYVNAIYNPQISVARLSSQIASGTHPGGSGLQQLNELTTKESSRLDRVAMICSADEGAPSNVSPGHAWALSAGDNGGGFIEGRWRRNRTAGSSRWTQEAIDFSGETVVEWFPIPDFKTISADAGPWQARALRGVNASLAVSLDVQSWQIEVGKTGPAIVGYIVVLDDPDASAEVAAAQIQTALNALDCPATIAEALAQVQVAAAAVSATVQAANIDVVFDITLSGGPATSGQQERSMADVLSICPVVVDMCIVRGDSTPFSFTLVDETGVPFDITGGVFLLTVDPQEEPTDALGNLFQLSGAVVAPGTNGQVQFSPTVPQTDKPPGEYFYDVQLTTPATTIRTIIKGKFTIQQDITK